MPTSAHPSHHMGNWYHIPDVAKQHFFSQATLHKQNIVAEGFGISTGTVCHIIKNVYGYGQVSPKPLRIGRPRELSWDDITVSLVGKGRRVGGRRKASYQGAYRTMSISVVTVTGQKTPVYMSQHKQRKIV